MNKLLLLINWQKREKKEISKYDDGWKEGRINNWRIINRHRDGAMPDHGSLIVSRYCVGLYMMCFVGN